MDRAKVETYRAKIAEQSAMYTWMVSRTPSPSSAPPLHGEEEENEYGEDDEEEEDDSSTDFDDSDSSSSSDYFDDSDSSSSESELLLLTSTYASLCFLFFPFVSGFAFECQLCPILVAFF